MTRQGRVVTLYSFKGGVGRTMAAANIAYHAASNGMRVLLMDWDLEAPGLPYYFRGHLDPQELTALVARPGVVDLVWDWSAAAQAATSKADVDALIARFSRPETFQQSVTTLISSRRLGGAGQIDLISAGAAMRQDRSPALYEEALAAFSWTNFFEEAAGGAFISQLRNWAKAEYDLVLVDSRTGFADVAGICTIQLPDTVLLCFVLNRQNVEGIAKVAASIRALRGDEVGLRLVPMRVSSGQPGFEEADALGWASRELRQSGGLDGSHVDADMEQLAIRLSDSVPFYESLAAFMPPDPTVDPLTLNYLALAKAVVQRSLEVKPIDPSWRDTVRRRLVSNRVTVSYLQELKAAEPSRAIEELGALLAAAIATSTLLDEDYVSALVETTFEIVLESDVDGAPEALLKSVQTLLRQLAGQDLARWRMIAVEGLSRYEAISRWRATTEEEAASIEEIEALLAGAEPSHETLLQRSEFRRRLSRLRLESGDAERAMTEAEQALDLASEAAALARSDQDPAARFAMAEAIMIMGDLHARAGDLSSATGAYNQVLQLVEEQAAEVGAGVQRLVAHVHTQLAQWLAADRPEEAAEHALRAVRPGTSRSSHLVRLPTLVNTILAAPDSEAYAARLLQALHLAGSERGGFSILNLARAPEVGNAFISSVVRLFGAAPQEAWPLGRALLLDSVAVGKRLTSGVRTRPRGLEETGALLQEIAAIAAAASFEDISEEAFKVAQRFQGGDPGVETDDAGS